MGLGITEINHHTVAHVFGDEAVETRDCLSDRLVIGVDQVSQILGINLRGQGGRADDIAKHDCQLAAFGLARAQIRLLWRWRRRCARYSGTWGLRSEERRVGKERRSRCATGQWNGRE